MKTSSILALALLASLLAAPALGAPADDSRPTVPASEILAKIERGEQVEYDGFIVVGDLDISGLDLPKKHVERTEDEIRYWGLTEEMKIVESPISIKESEIRGDVDLGNAIFQEVINFEVTNFSGDAYFVGANFSGDEVSFENSIFYHTLMTLEDAKNIRILRLSNSTFENGSTISLKGTDYERLYFHWDSIKDALVYNGEVYLTLVKNFKNIEYFEDADDCYYQDRRERQSMRSCREGAKYTDILGWVTCRYGTRPGYTLLLGFFVVLVSAVYYWRADAIKRLKGN